MAPDKLIRETFRVKKHDTLPFTGFLKSTRKDIALICNELGLTLGAEIGVESGLHAKTLFNHISGLKLICIDPWKAYGRRSQEVIDERYNNCVERLKEYDVKYMKMTSMEAVKTIPDRSLDFVYLDGMHDFDNVILDLIHWTKKVRNGGIIAGHDYLETFWKLGVVPAVKAYTHAHNINNWYITTNDRIQSYFWVQRKEYDS